MTGQARVYSQIDVDIVSNGEPGTSELLNPRRPSQYWAPVYRDIISNLDETALDDMTTLPGTYMIISKENGVVNSFRDSLIEWKTRKGFDVVYDTRPSWTASQIRQAIRDMYNDPDTNLEFVCLMGDPSGSLGIPTDGSNYDHTFGLANTEDDIEDIAVGRLCCPGQSDFATVNAKIMGYERNPYMAETSWFGKGFLYAGLTGMNDDLASNYTLLQWGATQIETHTGIDDITVLTHYGHVNETVVQNQLEDGRSVFIWRGGWISQMSASLPDQCDTGWRLPLCWTVTCATGGFDSPSPCVSEKWLTAGSAASPKGGICGIGTATSATHAPQNITLAGGLIYALANEHLEHLGTILSSSKIWLSKSFGYGSSEASSFSRYCNLLGDPGLSLWTDVPVIMDVDHPTTLSVGAREVSVTVLDPEGEPIEDALVVLWKGTYNSRETYVKALTNSSGEATLPVTVNTTGNLRLTITKRNHKPHLYEIPCVVVNQMLAYESATIDDDMAGGTSGNNNSIVNPGETVDFAVTLKNHGSTGTATSISATLSCENPNITILDAIKDFPDISSGSQQVADGAFRFQVSPTMKHDELAQFILTVGSDGGPSTSAINIYCQAGKAAYNSHQFSPTVFNPGDTNGLSVTITNTGSLEMTNVSAELISNSPFVSVDNPTAAYGDIAVDQQVNNNTDMFQLTANSLTFPGHQASMLLIMETSGGYRDSTRFTITVGTTTSTDPTGPECLWLLCL